MKRHCLILLSSLLLPLALHAQQRHVSDQPTPRGILLEEFTGIHCGFCPQGHTIAAAMEALHKQVSVIAVHAGGYAVPSSDEPDFRTLEGAYINDYFGISGYPSGLVNRHNNGAEQSPEYILSRSNWVPAAKEVINDNAEVNLWAQANYDGTANRLNIDIEGLYMSDEEADYRLNVAITQSRILGPQNGAAMGFKYVHNHMLRMYATPIDGEPVTIGADAPFFSKSYSLELPAFLNETPIDPLNIDVVVFLTRSMEEVVNATTVHPAYTNVTATGVIELADDRIPYNNTYFAGDKITALAGNRTAKPISSLTVSTAVGDITGSCEVALAEPLMPGESTTITVTLPKTLGEERANITLQITAADGTPITSEKVTMKVDKVPLCSTTGTLEVRADEDFTDNTWLILDLDGNVALDCGTVEYTGTEAKFDVQLQDGKYYCILVSDEWGNGVLDPRGKVRYANTEGSMQVQNLNIEGFGTRLFFKADASKDPASAIDGVSGSDAAPERFNVDGTRRAAHHTPGIAIERRGGKTSKTATK